LAHRKCQLLTRTCLDTVSRCRVPRMLTPLASSAGGAFTIECPAIDVLCHRRGTVYETSGFRHRLARLGQPTVLTVDCLPQACIDLCDQIRAGTERFKNNAAHESERLPSYQRTRRVLSRESMLRARLSTRGKQHRVPVHPTYSTFPCTVCSPRPLVKGCLGSCRARPRFSVCVFQRHTAVTKDTSDRRLQSHISKTSTHTSRGYRPAFRSFPRCVPMNGAVHAAPSASAGFLDHRTRRSSSRYDAIERRAFDTPVTAQVSHSLR
jgi:hypothetical protein